MENELNDKSLEEINGGGGREVSDGEINTVMYVLSEMGISVTRELVLRLISTGGSTLRDFAKAHAQQNIGMANLIPLYD